jgi:hypothetical protein
LDEKIKHSSKKIGQAKANLTKASAEYEKQVRRIKEFDIKTM